MNNILSSIIILFLNIVFAVSVDAQQVVFQPFKSYEFYKKNYLHNEGRIVDSEKGYKTTSEGQAYMLFMCLELRDKKTFDLVYNWTNKNLRRKDGLYSWIWGKNAKNEMTVLDYNSAADADVHMARASIFAYELWKDEKYLKNAEQTIDSIWKKETKRAGKYLVLVPGVNQRKFIITEINPSYFAPYSFRVFKKYDPKHDWDELVDSSYYYLNEAMSKTKTGLPPNWALIKRGRVVLEDSERSDFSYDAVRVFWRIYSDYQKTKDKRALDVLSKSKFFIKKWKEEKNLYTNYKLDGQLRDKNKPLGSIAILLPAISLFDSKTAQEIYENEIQPYISPLGYWAEKDNYYGKNLMWFGKYMYITKNFLKMNY